MPELPEVETIRREMKNVLLGQTIRKIEISERRLRTLIPPGFEQDLENLTISSVGRRAKYILTGFERTSLTLVIHLGMSGRVFLPLPSSHHHPPERQKHEHVIFTFDSGQQMHFFDPRRFGSMTLGLTPESLFQGVGPEPLSEEFDATILKAALSNKKTSIKAALLDQRVVAGLGNIYVCEALHMARIHPERLAKDLVPDEHSALVVAIKDVLHKAIAAGGSTLRDYKRTDCEAGAFQHHFKVYNQKGKNCPTCHKNTIERIRQSGRSTYFCKSCQSYDNPFDSKMISGVWQADEP